MAGGAGGRHMVGRTRRIALRDFGYRPRKARVELAAYSAHVRLPFYFGSSEWSIPIRSIAVVDLTVPGSPRTAGELKGEFMGRTITYLFTTTRARSATTLLLFATPQRVPPLRLGPSVDPGVRPFLPFGYLSSRRARGAWVDGLLLRVDRPQEAVEKLVAAGALRGTYRDGAWRVDRAGAAARPASDPPWARRSVDRFDGLSRALFLSGAMLGWNLPTIALLLGAEVSFWGSERYFDPDIPRWAWVVAWGTVGAGVLCKVVAGWLYRRPAPEVPTRVRPPPGRPPPGRPPPGAYPPALAVPAAPDDAMANRVPVDTVVGGRRPATRPDPRGADRGRR